MKRVISTLLSLVLIFSLLPMGHRQIRADNHEDILWLDKNYHRVNRFSEGLAAVNLLKEGKRVCGYIDQNGVEVIPPKYDIALDFFGHFAMVKSGDDMYLIDKKGKEMKSYDSKGDSSADLIMVRSDDKVGFIDKNGKEIVPLKYDDAQDFSEGLAAVRLNEKWAYINTIGAELTDFKFDTAFPFADGRAAVSVNGKYGFIDLEGTELPLKYDRTSGFCEGMGMVMSNGKWGFINTRGQLIVKPEYSQVDDFSEGLAVVEDVNGKKGVIDKTGRKVVAPKYDVIRSFKEGLATVCLNEKWGFVDKNGVELIAPKYDDAIYCRDGMYAVQSGEKWGFVDKNGVEVIALEYDELASKWDFGFVPEFSEGLIGVRIGKKWGFVDKKGREVVPPKYDYVENFEGGVAPVNIGGLGEGKWGIMKNPLAKASAKPQDSEKPQAPADNGITAKYSTSKLSIDGVAAQGMEIYNIGGNNYFKLRDVAKLFDGTDKKFSVVWNNEKKLISLVSGENYVVAGGELSGGDGVDKSATLSTAKMELNSKEVNLKAYTIGGNNYFKLRDLCEILGVKVDWDNATQTILLKTK